MDIKQLRTYYLSFTTHEDCKKIAHFLKNKGEKVFRFYEITNSIDCQLEWNSWCYSSDSWTRARHNNEKLMTTKELFKDEIKNKLNKINEKL